MSVRRDHGLTRTTRRDRAEPEEEYGPQFVKEKAAARKSKSESKSKSKPNTHNTAKRSSESGSPPRQQRCRTDEEAAVFDKLHKALVGLGFQRSRATEAIERISKQGSLTETPMDQLLRQALWVLVPPASHGRPR